MELKRSGANRFHGWAKLFTKAPRHSWDPQNGQVVLEVSQVADGVNTFNYRLSLDIEEVARLIDLVATSGIEKSSPKIAEAFEKSVRALTRLSGVASGLSVAPQAIEATRKGAA